MSSTQPKLVDSGITPQTAVTFCGQLPTTALNVLRAGIGNPTEESSDGWSWEAPGQRVPAFPLIPIISVSYDAQWMLLATAGAMVVGNITSDALRVVSVHRMEEGQEISAALCLPMFVPSNTKTRPGGTTVCALVGCTNGQIAVFDETGTQLLSQHFHTSNVKAIHLRTVAPTKLYEASSAADTDEVLIVYEDNVVVSIDGPSLWMAVKVAAGYKEAGETVAADQISLIFKKWILQGQRTIFDVIGCGPARSTSIAPPAFNPVTGQFQATYQSSRYIGVGKPMIGYYAVEGHRGSMLSDVAGRVKGAVTNAVSSFAKSIFSTSPTAVAPTLPNPIQPPTPVTTLFTLVDGQRVITSAHPSPPRRDGRCSYIALVDSLGRISVLDVESGELICLWKGVRGATCGWVVGESQTDGKSTPSTSLPKLSLSPSSSIPHLSERKDNVAYDFDDDLYLVIYNPRRGLLDVFTPFSNARIHPPFHVDTDLSLTQTGTGILGAAYGGMLTHGGRALLVSGEGKVWIVNITRKLD
ncbi:Rab3 GTPase-activating protein non-catalytic subunit [Gaertneriomyces sp. JEL0708]|nr:Rab3 GTPase-activating protein non-catalytic subunit [Gaertneriomyces sp. JEL0708]